MPEDENKCPTCPPTGKTIIPAVRNDAPPGTIPDEHLAILRANAAKPEVKARFTETMTGRVIGPIRTETPAFVPVRALVEMPHQMPEIPPLDATGVFAEEAIHPRRPSGEVVDMPARVNRGATYISLHTHADHADIGRPQFMRDMTQPVAGIADPVTRAALSGIPLFRPATGMLYATNEGCEASVDYYWDDDTPDPDDRELAAVKKYVEDNAESLKPGDFIEVTLMPEGVVVYWEWIGGVTIPPACQRLERIKRHAAPPKLTLDLARRTGRVHKITAGGPQPEVREELPESDEEEPPPPPPMEFTCLSYTPDRSIQTTYWRKRDKNVQQPAEGTPIWATATFEQFKAKELFTEERLKVLRRSQSDCSNRNGVFALEVVDHQGKQLDANANVDVEGAGVQVVCYECPTDLTCPNGTKCVTKERKDAEGNVTGVYCDCI